MRDNEGVKVSLHHLLPWYRLFPAGRCGAVWATREHPHLSSGVPEVGDRRRSSFLGKQQGMQHILTVPGIPGLSIISSSFYQQEFVSPPPDRLEILVLPSLSSFLVGSALYLPVQAWCSPALGWGLALGSAWHRNFPCGFLLCQDSLS